MSAIQELNDLAINYVSSNEELLAKAKELLSIEWHTVKIPTVAHLTVVQAAYSDTTVVLHIAVKDSFAKKLMEEYAEGFEPKRSQEG